MKNMILEHNVKKLLKQEMAAKCFKEFEFVTRKVYQKVVRHFKQFCFQMA